MNWFSITRGSDTSALRGDAEKEEGVSANRMEVQRIMKLEGCEVKCPLKGSYGKAYVLTTLRGDGKIKGSNKFPC